MAARSTGRGSRWRWGIALGVIGIVGSGALAPVAAGAVDPSADLSIGISHTPDTATAPADITFTITASNAGPDTAENAVAGLGFQYPLELREMPSSCKRTAAYESVVCDLGDIASGGTATVDITLFARGSGLYQLPAVIASDTPDPDAADRSITDSLIVKAGPSQGVRYIKGVFPLIMNRNPDTATTNYWAAKWKTAFNTWPRKLDKIPAGIMNSSEYRRLRIRESYQRILGRAADPSSLTYWVNKAASGWSFERIDATLLSSREFRSNGDLETYIRKTYVAVLGRQPTSAELTKWKAALAPGDTIGWTDFPRSLQRSTEAFDRLVKARYQLVLGQAPSNLGRYFWIVALRDGTSPEALFAQLLVSNEVLAKYPTTPDDYEEYYDAVPVADVEAAIASANPTFN